MRPHSFRMGPKSSESILKRNKNGHAREEGDVKTEAEFGLM